MQMFAKFVMHFCSSIIFLERGKRLDFRKLEKCASKLKSKCADDVGLRVSAGTSNHCTFIASSVCALAVHTELHERNKLIDCYLL